MTPVNMRTTVPITTNRKMTAPVPPQPVFLGSGSVRRTAIGRVAEG